MKFTLRHTLLAVAAIALIIAAWIATANHIDHQGDGYSVEQLEAALRSVDETDPESDVSRRTNSGDFRFAGCWGEPGGPFFPGSHSLNGRGFVTQKTTGRSTARPMHSNRAITIG